MARHVQSAQKALTNQVDIAADYYSRYPGETIIFFARVEVRDDLGQFTLRVSLSPGLELVKAHALNAAQGALPLITLDEGSTHVIWDVKEKADGTNLYEVQVDARALASEKDAAVEAKAVLSAQPAKAEGEASASAEGLYLDKRVAVAIKSKGRLMKYLPSIYHEDDLMARLLMLFDSFLAPIEKQINNQEYYLDPQLTPPEFLDWLASWVGLTLDPDISERQRRHLLHEAARLYKMRGTRQGLIDYLEIVTGGRVEIVEHFSENFRLGPESYMGPGIALGKENIPNTFGVKLFLPPLPGGASDEEKLRYKTLWERKTQAIIEAEKPVHSGYELSLEYDRKGSSR